MNVISADFVSSVAFVEDCPKEPLPEFAFVGRSNVGKSSLINYLVNKKNLAKTSSMPGKTRTINHYVINQTKRPWFLVDLPGYGFANAPEKARKKWEKNTREYIIDRKNLMCTFVLIDSRHKPQELDSDFIRWLAKEQAPMAVIFTKTDKLKPGVLEENLELHYAMLSKFLDGLPNVFISSASERTGATEVLDFVTQVMKTWIAEK
ncbi:MAG: ribosome biogenesis GTP-binding protein YihA/YsxC [Flavobacteriales bacterium]|nr:ribosome biogenesis GTP-binding protein YihA/YsxC [Flavobacteriales bacterium]